MLRRRPSPFANNGFTLVEMLVALLILALLGLMSWRGLDGMVRAQQVTRTRADQIQTLQTGFAQWATDLDAMIEGPDPHAIDWSSNVLRVTRRGTGTGADGLRVVAWTVRESDGVNQWARWQSPLLQTAQDLDAAWAAALRWGQGQSALTSSAGGVGGVAVVPVTGWQLFYFRGNSWANALSSADTAAARPDAVRLQLDLAPGGTLVGRLTRDWLRPTLAGNKS